MPKPKLPRTAEQKKEVRKKIARVMVQDRMGLNEEWLDPDTRIELPLQLPEFEGQGLTPMDRRDLASTWTVSRKLAVTGVFCTGVWGA